MVPGVAGLQSAAAALRAWQVDRAPMQLHPGDLGWHWRNGAEATAADVRVWSRNGRTMAIGLLDAPQLLRMAVDPDLQGDEALVERLVTDIEDPERGVLQPGSAVVEARCGDLLTESLTAKGWLPDEPWTPLHRDLSDELPDCGVRIEVVGPDGADVWSAIHWSAFKGTAMTDDDRRTVRNRWLAMASGAPYAEARCLTAFDERDTAVAIAGVWSAGPGRPGLLEPVGVHADHRGHGYGRAVTLSAAAALRELGSSSAVVCTPSSRERAVQTYVSAGFERFPDVRDLRRST